MMVLEKKYLNLTKNILENSYKAGVEEKKEKDILIKKFKELVQSIEDKLEWSNFSKKIDLFVKEMRENQDFLVEENFKKNLGKILVKKPFFKRGFSSEELDFLWIMKSSDFENKENHELTKLLNKISNQQKYLEDLKIFLDKYKNTLLEETSSSKKAEEVMELLDRILTDTDLLVEKVITQKSALENGEIGVLQKAIEEEEKIDKMATADLREFVKKRKHIEDALRKRKLKLGDILGVSSITLICSLANEAYMKDLVRSSKVNIAE